MNVPITPGTLLQDRFFVLRVLRPVEFGWLYRAVDQKQNGAVCLLEEFIIPDDVADRAAILQQKMTLEMQRFQLQDLPPEVAIAQPIFAATIVEQNRVFIVQSWGDNASYHQVLEDRVISGEGAAVLEEVEAVELLDGLEPLVRAFGNRGVRHGYLCRDTIVWQDGYDVPGLMHPGSIRSIALQYELDPIHDLTTVDDRQTDLQQLTTTVLDLLGDRPWNRISIQLANRLRILLEPEARLQFRSQAISPAPALAGDFHPPAVRAAHPAPSSPPAPPPAPIPAPKSQNPRSPRRRRKQSGLQKTIALIQQAIQPWIQKIQADPTLILMGFIAIGLCGTLGYRLISARFPTPAPTIPSPIPESPGFNLPPANPPSLDTIATSALSPEIETKLRSLNVSPEWFSATIAELSGDERDRSNALIKTLEALNPDIRAELGTYRRTNFDAWLTTVQSPGQSPGKTNDALTKQIEDATDAEFFKAFPDRKGIALNPRNLGQVWYAIARSEIAKVKR